MFNDNGITMFVSEFISKRKSIIKALTLIMLIFCCAMLVACGENSNKDKDADKVNSDKDASSEWIEIKSEDEYPELIDGDISVDGLIKALYYFEEPTNSDKIKKKFEKYGGFYIAIIFGPSETTIDDVPYDKVHYVYDIDDVNETICGITKFKFEKNKNYYEVDGEKGYTDDQSFHNILTITGDISNRHIELKDGRYNDSILEINFEDMEMESIDPEAEPISVKPCRAIFKKNKNGKFTLDSVNAVDNE